MLQSDQNQEPAQSPYDSPGQTSPPALPQHPTGYLSMGAITLLVVLFAAIFGIGIFAGWQFGRNNPVVASPATDSAPPGTNMDAIREAVIAKVRPAVVQINVQRQQGGGLGSGVIIDKRGYIVTNNHVVQGGQGFQVELYDGTTLPAQLTGVDPLDDLAVVKITPPKSISVANLGDSSKLEVGREVLAIGNPLGITQTVTNGIVSALGRTIPEGQNGAVIVNAIQTDAPINPGNSGGALVDLQGDLVGIPTLVPIDPEFKTPANGVGFAIPSNRVKFIAPQLIETGKVQHTGRAGMGIRATSVDAILAEQNHLAIDHGALIVNVALNSPAAQAGLKPGDVIVQIGNTPVNDVTSLMDALLIRQPGETVPVQVYRGNQRLTVNVKLGEIQLS
jgi:S1-C subfamily serine protease